MSRDPELFRRAVIAFAAANRIDRELAGVLLTEIGDTVETNEEGNVIARGREWIWPVEEAE
jgi:hypothetical protein